MKLALALSAAVAIFSVSLSVHADHARGYTWTVYSDEGRIKVTDSAQVLVRAGAAACEVTKTEVLIGGISSRVLTCRDRKGNLDSAITACDNGNPRIGRVLSFDGEPIVLACEPR